MSSIEYGTIIGVFSEDKKVRLDIGTDATKKGIPASHESWATRFIIKRLDGPNTGNIASDHLVGIFSEDGKYRLDLGTDTMKKNVDPAHESWATRLIIKRLNGANSGKASYGDIVGLFSEDNKYRLDIGTDAMKKNVAASHESWATRLHIQDVDPVIDIEIASIDYDIANAKTLSSGPAELYRQRLVNDTSLVQTNTIMGEKSTEETSGWSDSLGIMVGVKTKFSAGIPIIADVDVEISTEITNTFTWNGSTTTSKKWGFTCPVSCPPHSVTLGLVAATVSTIAVPYTLNGTSVRKSGIRTPVKINGIYTGTNSHDLTVTFVQQDTHSAVISSSVQAIQGTIG